MQKRGIFAITKNRGGASGDLEPARGPSITTDIMAYKINDDCISCGTCAGECPVEAISEGESHYEIDPAKCTSCGTCASACPVEAIHEA